MLYLASPYSSPDPAVRQARYEANRTMVAHLACKGYIVYSPIVHFHPVAVAHQLPTEFAFWQAQNRGMIDHADSLYVLQLEGWNSSIGVASELQYAAELGLPCIFIKECGCCG
jgi:hypothetical protein